MTRRLRVPIPFHQTGPAKVASPRRMLLLSYFFAPSDQVGARRWLHLSRYAAERDWAIDVLMMDPLHERSLDRASLQLLPAGMRLYGIPLRHSFLRRVVQVLARLSGALRPRRRPDASSQPASTTPSEIAGARGVDSWFRRTSRAVNAYVFFASCDDWIDRATAAGISLQRASGYDLVISSGPPHMAHVAARNVASTSDLPLVIDMRDAIALPEVEPPELASSLWRRRSGAWEKLSLDAAVLAVANTEELKEALLPRYASPRTHLITVMNGADPDVRIARGKQDAFVLAHTGSVYAGRDPTSLFRALALLVGRRNLTPKEIRLQLIGETVLPGLAPQDLAREAGVAAFVTVEPTMPRSVIMDRLSSAAMLVVLPQSIRYAIPAKLFEYVQAPAWVLALAEPGSSVGRILRGTTADVVDPNDVETIARVLETRYDMFRRGHRPAPVNADGRFDRSGEARKLMDELDRLVPPTQPAGSTARQPAVRSFPERSRVSPE